MSLRHSGFNRNMRSILPIILMTLLCPHQAFAEDRNPSETLELLTWTSSVYIEQRDCFSCHHQTLPALALRQAHRNGRKIDLQEVHRQVKFTHSFFQNRIKKMQQGQGVPGKSFTAGYALWLLDDNQWKADETTAAMIDYLRHRQQPDGHWKIGAHRPPIEYSDFTATALAIRGLKAYGDESDLPRINKARHWLSKNVATHQEARTYKLLGLIWSDAEKSEINNVVYDIFQQQHENGGWSQEKEMSPDAYATGQILVALLKAEVRDTHSASLSRGIEYLNSTRLPDGSWFVETRSRPIQKYFESGFPHDKSQFLSTAATSWATLAILLAEAKQHQ